MNYSGVKVLIMGLGLHGGGLETARFMLKRGADVTITDLRDEKTLMPSIKQLNAPNVRYVLGKHEIIDFKNADIVVKNPGVRPDSPFLQAAVKTETDISLFLKESPARLFAVTGTKGKSSTASALHWILQNSKQEEQNPGKAWLGGNITVSPLSFIDELTENDDVVLELSSFQLGDLKGRVKKDGSALLNPTVAVLTAIMSDHLDRYASMDEYIDDKRVIYRGQDYNGITVASDDNWGNSFLGETKAKPLAYSRVKLPEDQSGGWLDGSRGFARLLNISEVPDEITELVPSELFIQGEHQRLNLLAASLTAYSCGVKAETIRNACAGFKGVEHRLEFFHEEEGIKYYNDSAATIPEAAAACINALVSQGKLILVTGGTDKNLDFTPLAKAIKRINATGKNVDVILLAGSGSVKLRGLFKDAAIEYSGPFDDLDKAVFAAKEKAKSLHCVSVVLSPGCASFGMFLNEFDRGKKWKGACLRLA